MNKRLMTYRSLNFLISLIRCKQAVRICIISGCIITGLLAFSTALFAQGTLTIHFNHIANGRKLTRDTAVYANTFNEPYRVTKCRYYISNVCIKNELPGSYLIDAFGTDSIVVPLPRDSFNGISFLIGVDSFHNVAGAQSGALDPLNDMFWTWNTGYVTWKLEGFSDSSHADLHRIEQHIGGYRSPYNTSHTVYLAFPQPLVVSKQHSLVNITINCMLDEYWSSSVPNRIREQAVVVSPGEKAVGLSGNLIKLFNIATITHN